ncbi:MAG: hypothetical protein V1778_04160 [bacterium]
MSTEHVLWRRRDIFSDAPPGRENPLFPKKNLREVRKTHRRFWGIIVVLVIGFCVYGMFFSTFFSIRYVTEEGNAYIRSSEITTVVRQYLESKILGILPRSTYFAVSTPSLKHRLLTTLGKQQAIEAVTVQKSLAGRINIIVKERIPNLILENGGGRYLLDRTGTITKDVRANEHVDPSFPTILDQNTRTLTVGTHTLGAELIKNVFVFRQLLEEKTKIHIEYFYLPPVDCTLLSTPQEEGTPESLTNAAQATNTSDDTNEKNVNSKNVVPPTNANSSSSNLNTNSQEDICDIPTLVLQERDLRVKTESGWSIFFRTDAAAQEQVDRLVRVLRERSINEQTLQYIDLRFGERVILQ